MGFTDLYLPWAGDLQASATGDLAQAADLTLLQQRIFRRILSVVKAIIWEPTFGAGIPEFVCSPLSADVESEIQNRVITQVFLEEAVVRDPYPIITFTPFFDGYNIQIQVWTQSNQTLSLQFEVSRNGF